MKEKYGDLQSRLDVILQKCSIHQTGSIRTILDSLSTEWDCTNYETKLKFLEMVVDEGIGLRYVVMEYRRYYKSIDRSDIADSAADALSRILEYKIRKEKHDGSEKKPPFL
jgi:hypothetical protein